MKTKDLILKIIRQKGFARSAQIVKLAGISRQTAAQHFRELADSKRIMKKGSTRDAKYVSYVAEEAARYNAERVYSTTYTLKGLQEDDVFQEVTLRMHLSKMLSPAAEKIAYYAFTEMLNNAIDHSHAASAKVRIWIRDGMFGFEVIDTGVGAFESMRKKFHFKNHFEAVEHLLKGKQTVDSERHSGQGIFFTSRIANRFVIESAKLRLIVDNGLGDTFLEDIRPVCGTRVEFLLKQRSRKNLKALFDSFTNADFEFDRTVVKVHLSPKEGEYVARSEAKRLLFGLEKFRRIVLDFQHVTAIGQGFADEVFRVFPLAHPGVTMDAIAMSQSVEFMVQRARAELSS